MPSNAELIARISRFQNIGHFHPLTCQKESSHEQLRGEEREGQVVLVCPTCGHVQDQVPAFMKVDEFEEVLKDAEDVQSQMAKVASQLGGMTNES
ncbi:MAG: hypothetical protein KW788_01315 [Candidatus Doudnabacteria bacterium]|nr:hypothetical protein [Candidatus Doudnabacteria bacterium]